MKKFLKILLIIVGIVFLIFAALICIGLFVDYDDHIENGRYTYVPEEENKDNEYVEFMIILSAILHFLRMFRQCLCNSSKPANR